MLEALLKKKNNDGPFRYVYWVILVVFAALVARLVWLQLFIIRWRRETAYAPYPWQPCAVSCTIGTARYSSVPDLPLRLRICRRRAV